MCLVRLSYKKTLGSWLGFGKYHYLIQVWVRVKKNWPPLRTGELLVSMGRVCLVRFGYRTMGQG